MNLHSENGSQSCASLVVEQIHPANEDIREIFADRSGWYKVTDPFGEFEVGTGVEFVVRSIQ